MYLSRINTQSDKLYPNILINAAKYSKENSLIRVTTAIQPDNIFRVFIRDEGPLYRQPHHVRLALPSIFPSPLSGLPEISGTGTISVPRQKLSSPPAQERPEYSIPVY